MAKETKKQIKAQIINEVQRSYKQKIDDYEERIRHLSDLYHDEQVRNHDLRREVSELKDSNNELKDKVVQYEEWVERMQDFCNMPEEERHKAFATYLDEIESKATANAAISRLERLCSAFVPIMF